MNKHKTLNEKKMPKIDWTKGKISGIFLEDSYFMVGDKVFSSGKEDGIFRKLDSIMPYREDGCLWFVGTFVGGDIAFRINAKYVVTVRYFREEQDE